MYETYKFPFPKEAGIVHLKFHRKDKIADVSIFIYNSRVVELTDEMINTIELVLFYSREVLKANRIRCIPNMQQEMGIPGLDVLYKKGAGKCSKLIKLLNSLQMVRVEQRDSIEWQVE
jgi:hypothetical protein